VIVKQQEVLLLHLGFEEDKERAITVCVKNKDFGVGLNTE